MQGTYKVLLMMETSRKYGRSILRGISKYSRLNGPWIFYRQAPFYWDIENKNTSIEHLLNLNIDGIILREQRETGLTEKVLAKGLPVVVSPYRELFQDLPNIITDDEAIGKIAAEHLLHKGFRHFAYCGFGSRYYWSRERGKSFLASIEKAGFKAHSYEYEQPKSEFQHSWEQEQNILVDWLSGLPKPVAIMACNDDRSQHVLEACKIAGFEVPEQVAIIGLGDDDLVCDLAMPPLSSIAIGAEKAGFEAAAMLDKLMSSRKVSIQNIIVPTLYIAARQSTDILKINDPYVAQALQFIHKFARKESIQVSDVLKAVPVSRRSLYERFARVLGRSVHEEIKHVRADQFARMLVDTNLPVSQIASLMGCADMKNLARYFKQAKGLSPLQYRKQYSLR
ncbi:MAG: XylR family transcriptional regulator [Sedimentisphaerales bacterium]|nr:XylR family transcriptional regulator [Sedimentisphaerales bacterium]